MINIEQFKEVDFRIGEVIKVSGDEIQINCDNKTFLINMNLDVKEKDKIVVIINKDKLVIPAVKDNVPIVPEKDIEPGSKIS